MGRVAVHITHTVPGADLGASTCPGMVLGHVGRYGPALGSVYCDSTHGIASDTTHTFPLFFCSLPQATS